MPNLQDPTKLKQLCTQHSLIPSKRYGQNFLINSKPIIKMVETAKLSKQDTVCEIGPGFGVLTFELIKQAKQVKAFEIEKKLQAYWQKNKSDNLEIIWGNVLQADLEKLDKNYKVVANLPYQITSAVLRKFLESKHQPQTMIIMVQKEVAERICAQAGQMTVLSVSVQYYGQPEIVINVPKSYFWPSPKVDSAVLSIKNIKQPKYGFTDKQFFQIVKIGFANKRKLLLNNLLKLFIKDKKDARIKLIEIFNKLDLDKNIRAQELDLIKWIKLVGFLVKM